MNKKLLTPIIILATTFSTFAQWTNSGPNIGANRMKQNNNRTYLFYSRLYHSDDNGNTWNLENTPAINYTDLLFLSGKIIAATEKGIFVSYNNGLNWLSHSTGIPDSTNGIRDIEQIGTRLIATSTASIYYSDNYGISWNVSNITGTNVRQIAVQNNTILINAFAGVYRSIDNGLTYSYSNTGISGTNPNIVNLFNLNNVAYCLKASSVEVYKSVDEGISWSLCNTGLSGTSGNFTNVNSKLYLGNVNGIFEFNAATNTWSISPLSQSIAGGILHFNNGKYFALHSNNQHLVSTIDNGQTWQEADSGALMASIGNLIVTENNSLFGIGSGLFSFNEVDSTWSRFTSYNYDFGGTLLSSLNTQIYCISYGAGNQYYIGTNGGVWSSNDNGVTWIQHHIGLPITNTLSGYKTVKDLYINGNSIVAATTSGIYRSTDQANTWTQVSTLSCNDLHQYGSYLYATGNGVFRSNDNGLTWTAFAGATSGGPFLYITGAGGKIFTIANQANMVYADTSATSFSNNGNDQIKFIFGYQNFLFYIGTAGYINYYDVNVSVTAAIDASANLPCYQPLLANCYEPYLSSGSINAFGDNLWLGTSGFSTYYRSLGDFGFPVTTIEQQAAPASIPLVVPNPANETISLKNIQPNTLVTITNITGNIVLQTTQNQTNQINISHLSSGLYFIQTQSKNYTQTTKFIKQ